MATKCELATELRKLSRDIAPLPISKMKKSELMKAIEAIKQIRSEKEKVEVPETKPGPLGPRSIKIAPIEIDKDIIKSPKLPEKRLLKPMPKFETNKTLPKGVLGNSSGLGLRRVITTGADSDDDEHKCNCEHCPVKRGKK